MNYINTITEIPCNVRLTIPLFADIVVVYEDIIEGGSSETHVFDNVVDGGDSETITEKIIDGGTASVTGGTSFSGSHILSFVHRATQKIYNIPCKLINKDNMYITLEVVFNETPFVGQYTLLLEDIVTNEILYNGLLEIRPTIRPLYQYQNNTEIIQKQ